MPSQRSSRFRRFGYVGLFGIVLAIVAFNGIAWMQARAMTQYLEGATVKTKMPELLSLREKAWIVMTGVRVPRPANTETPETLGLTYETHIIEISQDEHLEAWFSSAGVVSADLRSRGVVILFPPYGGSKQALLAPGKIFHELGYDTLWVDFRGAGGSTGSDTTLGVREGEDVAHAMRYVEQTWADRPVVLFGGSMGAVAVMRAIAHENITPDAVILESPFDRLLNTVRRRFSASGLPTFPSAETLVFWGGLQQGIDGFAHNPTEYAKSMDMPVLLMQGEADTRVKNEDAKAVFEQLPGPKELVVFPTIGHGKFASDDPTGWTQQVQAFLDDVKQRP
ncbi:MAG: alpha/beta fold hydrolase [Cyanobacteria bacterium P01_D01_bin.36]